MADDLYVMTPMEIVFGYLLGHEGMLPPPTDETCGPRVALETVISGALRRAPCAVSFSGGRDSSLVLAVATHVARRDGLPLPIPMTNVFPGVAESQEDEWQEAVIRHLGLDNWERIPIHDELDLLGPRATEVLRTHGVLWPPTIATDLPMLEAVAGGSLMDGEGGDDVLGAEAHRISPVTRLIRRPRPVRWRRVRPALKALAPAAVRWRTGRDRPSERALPWLRPMAMDTLLAELERAEHARPLSFAASVRMVPQRRGQVLGARNRHAIARSRDVQLLSPLLHPDVVHALARDGGVIGRGDRAAVLRAIAADLLPDSNLSRTSKAAFTRAYMGSWTRRFAQQWSGDGVDHDLVDADELRRQWLADPPPAPTAALLQSAWLASVGNHAP